MKIGAEQWGGVLLFVVDHVIFQKKIRCNRSSSGCSSRAAGWI